MEQYQKIIIMIEKKDDDDATITTIRTNPHLVYLANVLCSQCQVSMNERLIDEVCL